MKQVTAVKACQEAGLDFSECFKWQYVVSEAADIDLPMQRHAVGGWSIYTGKGLAFTKLMDASGSAIGCLLGIGVDETGLASDVHTVDANSNSDQFFAQIEKWLHVLAGRYTVFVCNKGSKRIYSDAVGMNGCVYNAQTRMVASSVLLTLDRPLKEHPRYPKDHIENGGKYSLFHTSDPEVTRCNPSNYLDLESFEELRFWPGNHAFTAEAKDLTTIYDRLRERTKFIVDAICEDNPVAFPISGGQDSRFLLAMAGPAIRKIDYFFTHIHN